MTAVHRLSQGRIISPWQLTLLAGLTALGAASTDIYAPAFPSVQSDLHTSQVAVQSTVAVFLLSMALGQIVVGQVSDSIGRRPALLIGVVGYVGASVACAVAPTVTWLLVSRAVQGLGAAAGVVIGRATIQDRAHTATATKPFSQLVVMTGLAPILGPMVGAGLLHIGSWRWIFVVQAALGASFAIGAIVSLPETLSREQRRPIGLRAAVGAQAEVLANPQFRRYALAFGLAAGVVFGYVSSYSFVLEVQWGSSPFVFAILFGLNALGMVALAQLNPPLVDRFGPTRVLIGGLLASTAAAAALVASVVWPVSVLLVALPTWVVIASRGTILPNLTSVAMSSGVAARGTASALLGSIQWTIGAVATVAAGLAPNPGIGMSVTMLTFSAATLLAASGGRRRGSVTLAAADQTAANTIPAE